MSSPTTPGVARLMPLATPGRILSTAVLAALLVLAAFAPGDLGPQHAGGVASIGHPRPNIVLIVTDDQRADTLSVMPQVQRLLVDKGVRFTNGMVPTSLCCPSRSSILTGLFAHHTRVFSNGDVDGGRFGGYPEFHRRGLEYRTVATALAARGYYTGFFGKYLNHFARTTMAGFTPPGWDEFTAFDLAKQGYYRYGLSDGTDYGTAARDYSTDVLARRATRFVTRAPSDQPLFLMVAPYGPHNPFTAAPRHANAVVSPTPLPPEAMPGEAQAAPPLWQLRRRTDPAAGQDVRVGQARALLSVDDAVGSIVAALRRTGRVHDTLFVFLSDNGLMAGEHGLQGKDVPYDAATRIPLLLRWDGHAPAGVVDDRLALNVDVAATLSAASAATMQTDGLDLLGRRTRHGFPLEATTGYQRRPAYCGWRTKRWLYVRYDTGRSELYDYRADPYEQHDRADDPAYQEVQARLRALATEHCRPEPPGFDW